MPAQHSHSILEHERALRTAQLRGDITALDRLLDERLQFTGLDGTVIGKADDLALYRACRLRITRMDPIRVHVLDLGPTVVVAARMDTAASMDGILHAGALDYTRVWHRTAVGWRVVAGHMSAVR